MSISRRFLFDDILSWFEFWIHPLNKVIIHTKNLEMHDSDVEIIVKDIMLKTYVNLPQLHKVLVTCSLKDLNPGCYCSLLNVLYIYRYKYLGKMRAEALSRLNFADARYLCDDAKMYIFGRL